MHPTMTPTAAPAPALARTSQLQSDLLGLTWSERGEGNYGRPQVIVCEGKE